MQKANLSELLNNFLGVAVTVRMVKGFTLVGHITGYTDVWLQLRTKDEIGLLNIKNIVAIKVKRAG